MNFTEFEKLPLIGILRGITKDMVKPIAKCCINSGLKALEITMNTENAPQLIKLMIEASEGKFAVGAGTVLNTDELDQAIHAGASFIVTPTVQNEVIRSCVSQKIPCFPGAFTPTEILQAWNLGASMIKVFPSSIVGPKYFTEIKGPLNHIKLLACGGVSKETLPEFFKSGADGAAFGGSIFKKSYLKESNYSSITDELKAFINSYKSYSIQAQR